MRPETLKLVDVTFVPAKLLNEMLVDVREVPFAVPNERLVAKKFAVELAFVKIAVDAPLAPIAVLLIVPPSMVKAFTTSRSSTLFAGRVKDPVKAKLVEVRLVVFKLVGLKVVTASVPKNPLVEVILVPFAVPKVRLVELKVSANALVEVNDPPVAVVKDNAPVLKLVLVALPKVVVPKLVRPETLKLVDVTFVPAKLLNEMLVDVREVPFAVPNERLVAKKFAVELAFVKIAVDAPLAPIAVLLIVPPSMVRPSITKSSKIELVGKFI